MEERVEPGAAMTADEHDSLSIRYRMKCDEIVDLTEIRSMLVGLFQPEERFRLERVIVSAMQRAARKFSKAVDCVDLMRDEFLRIKAIAEDSEGLTCEIVELCNRAISNIERNVPVIVEVELLGEEIDRVNKLYEGKILDWEILKAANAEHRVEIERLKEQLGNELALRAEMKAIIAAVKKSKTRLKKKEFIRAIERKNMSQSDFARSIRVDKSAITKWLAGHPVSAKARGKIMIELECSWDDVFTITKK